MSRTRHTVPSAVHGRAWTKNRENNPMQSRVNPGSQHSCCAASGAAIWNAASMPRISVPLSGASNRMASPAWFGAAVTPARHPQASAAASISAISANRSGAVIMRTEPAAAIPPSVPQFAESSSPRTLPRSETNSLPSGAMMRVWVENRANVPPRRCGSWAAKPSAMIKVAPAATVAVVSM